MQRIILFTMAAVMLCGMVSGCGIRLPVWDASEAYVAWAKSRTERLRLFEHIQSIAVAPIINDSSASSDYVARLEQTMMNQLVRIRRFREVKSVDVLRKALAGKSTLPQQPEDVQMANALSAAKTDAILVIHIKDFDPYNPPRVTLQLRLYATRRSSATGFDPISMSDDGIPLDIPQQLHTRFIWAWDYVMDSSRQVVRQKIVSYLALATDESYPGTPETFARSLTRFFTFTCFTAATRLRKDALAFKRMPAPVVRKPEEAVPNEAKPEPVDVPVDV